MDRYVAGVGGFVNGTHITVTGRGSFDLGKGTVSGSYELGDIPQGMDALIYNSVLITGYPSVCAGDDNPFSDRSYSYVRKIDLGRYGKLEYQAECKLQVQDDRETFLESSFELTATLEVPKLIASEPVVETWVPNGRNVILGIFTIGWRTEAGCFVVGHAQTHYSLPGKGPELRGIRHRFIRLENQIQGATMVVHQQSMLLGEG